MSYMARYAGIVSRSSRSISVWFHLGMIVLVVEDKELLHADIDI